MILILIGKILQQELILPSLEQLPHTIERLKEEEIDILGISGGDGTIHQVLCALYKVYGNNPWPQIALLPSGTMNNISREMGIKGKSTTLLRKTMNKLRNEQPLRVRKRFEQTR